MVMKDAELDELWRGLGSHRGEIRNHLEAAIAEEQTASSLVTERMFREYRDLKADYERDHEHLEKLQADYQKRIAELLKKTDPKGELQVIERELSQLVSDTATYNLDRIAIANRVAGTRDGIRRKLRALGFQGNF